MVEPWITNEMQCSGTLSPERRSANYRLLQELNQKTLDEKVSATKEIIETGLTMSFSDMVIACSFGKDSVVLLSMLLKYIPDIEVVYCNTGVEFKETLEFAGRLKRKWNLNLSELKPQEKFWNVIREFGYPRESREGTYAPCCYYLKEKPMIEFVRNKDALVFTGFTIDEGQNRRMAFIRKGTFIYAIKKWGCFRAVPLLFWNENDIWEYIKRENLPVNPVYEKYGIPRQGCMWCTGHKNWQEQILKINPRVYEKIQKDMGQTLLTSDTPRYPNK